MEEQIKNPGGPRLARAQGDVSPSIPHVRERGSRGKEAGGEQRWYQTGKGLSREKTIKGPGRQRRRGTRKKRAKAAAGEREKNSGGRVAGAPRGGPFPFKCTGSWKGNSA